MEEAERLADRIVVVDNGLVVASGTLDELLELLPATQSLELDVDRVPDLEGLRRLPGVQGVRMEGRRLVATLDSLARDSASVLAGLASMGVKLKRFSSGRANLEDVFLSLTGRRLRD
jgi:ABC-2 type transport system ATP-binding protein